MLGILRACSGLAPVDLVIAVKSIKHLSTSPFLLDVLQNADTISVMIRILGDNLASFGTTVCSVTRLAASHRAEM